jgi:hypothetical protein
MRRGRGLFKKYEIENISYKFLLNVLLLFSKLFFGD